MDRLMPDLPPVRPYAMPQLVPPDRAQRDSVVAELNRRVSGWAIQHGGCTLRCRFVVQVHEMPYLPGKITDGVAIRLRHNGRDVTTILMPHIIATDQEFRRTSTHDVMREAHAWLRGLHRFPVELGIK